MPREESRRTSRRLLASLTGVALLALGLGCDDPMKAIGKAIDEGRRAAVVEARRGGAARAPGNSGDFSDDEAARRAAGGISLGPGDAKRLYYQFIDARGRVAFVDRLDDVPAAWRDKVGFVEMDSAPPLSPGMAEQTRDRRYAANGGGLRASGRRVAAHMPGRVVLYSADWCGWCRKAKRHLDGMGINYEIRDIDIPENLNDLVAKTGQKGIPVLDVGGRIVTGFAPDQYEQLLRARG